ncbi:transposase family protein [Streptomyces sp. NPDC056161]|uniref:transposase family protein n=1 Tax=Streptomyces sp. NPDC056161 TaxID=3345732 RepID=UPI0035D9AAF3
MGGRQRRGLQAVHGHRIRWSAFTAKLRDAGVGAIGDLGFIGLDDDPDDSVIITGKKAARKRPLTDAQKEANKLVSRERAANEHAFADLNAWRILAKVRMSARHATDLLRALLVLTRLQVTR